LPRQKIFYLKKSRSAKIGFSGRKNKMDLIPMFPILENTLGKNYAQGAFNATSFQQVKAILETHDALRSPAIIQVGNIALGFLGNAVDMNKPTLEEKRRGAKNVYSMLEYFKDSVSIPVALHADHVKDIQTIKILIEEGFTSVMIDGSHLSFEENIEITREVVKYAHPYGVTVEGELGVLAGQEDDVFSKNSTYTNPMKVVEFLKKTKADCLALSYGTKHGVKKGTNVKLRKEIVVAAMENMRHEGINAVLVSHGSSTVPAYLVEDNNKVGGKINNAGGVPIDELKEIIKCGISKINIDTDLRLAVTRNIREYLTGKQDDIFYKKIWENLGANPEEIDFRVYLEPMKEYLIDSYLKAEAAAAAITKCMEKGVTEIVSALIVQFGSIGYANRIKKSSLLETAERYKK
jgi:fructose-bisphosphate aldolase, class II